MNCIECKTRPVAKERKLCSVCVNKRQHHLFMERRQIEGSNAWIGYKRRNLKSGARRRGLSFELSCADMRIIYASANSNCPYCDKPMNKPSVDRIDNELGYTVSNCILICWQCNKAKSNLTKTQIRNIYRYLFG